MTILLMVMPYASFGEHIRSCPGAPAPRPFKRSRSIVDEMRLCYSYFPLEQVSPEGFTGRGDRKIFDEIRGETSNVTSNASPTSSHRV